MGRTREMLLLCLVLVLSLTPGAFAQPKLVLTQVGNDMTGDGNTVVGSILDANVYGQMTSFTRGVGFQFLGPVYENGTSGQLRVSDVSGGNFFATFGLPNGFGASPLWPPSGNAGLTTNYAAFRPCCDAAGNCTMMVDSALCTGTSVDIQSSTCAPNTCQLVTPTSTGACCNRTTQVCTLSTQSACTGSNFYWIGNLTTCGNYPCSYGHTLPFRYSTATNTWNNCGSFPNNTGGAGLGAAVCDDSCASPYAMSSDGRFIVGGALYGGFGTTACNPRGFIFDSNDGSMQMLPQIGTAAGNQNFSQGYGISTSGAIVLGRDTHAITDPSGVTLSSNTPCLTVWERDPASGNFLVATPRACCNGASCTVAIDAAHCPSGTMILASTTCAPGTCPATPPTSGSCCSSISLNCTATTQAACAAPNFWIGGAACSPRNPCLAPTEIVLDQYGGGNLGGAVITRSGTTVAGTLSSYAATYELADSSQGGALCKYVRNAGTGQWQRTVLPRVAGSGAGDTMTARAISADGNTIVGTYSGGLFYWKSSLNGGVPLDLGAYLQTLNGGQPFPQTGSLGGVTTMSADGNALLVSWNPPPPASCGPGAGLQDLNRSGILYLDGSGVGCVAPVIAGGPYDVHQVEFTRFGMVGNVFFAGSYPMTIQWQKESPSFSNNWVNLQDSCGQFTQDNSWTYEGTDGVQLRVNELADPSVRDGRYRVVISNSCGTATSAVANISAVIGACCAYDANSGGVTCTITLPTQCTGNVPFGAGGVYIGDNTTCTPTACNSVVGACCTNNGGVTCVADVGVHCTASVANNGLGGSFAGGGTSCTPTACDALSGACCYSPDSLSPVTCTFELSSHCTQAVSIGGLAGVYAGNGTACSPGALCPPGTPNIGACCYNATLTSDIACTIQTSANCTGAYSAGGLQGKYLGDGFTCSSTSMCKPSSFDNNTDRGSGLGACCFTDPNNPASGALCVIAVKANCVNYLNGSNDLNTAPFTPGVGGNFYTNTCCEPSTTAPISGCTSTAPCASTAGACFHTPFDNSSALVCTVQVRASRCTNPYNAGGLYGAFAPGAMCSPDTMAQNTGACCYLPTDFDGNQTGCVVCTIQPQARCTNPELLNGGLSGVYGGNGTVCSPIPQCPAQYGACCTGNICAVVARSACTGTLFGVDSTSCEPVSCAAFGATQPPPTGACCDTSSLGCTVTIKTACASNHAWLATASCSPSNPCVSPASGACCLSFGSCEQTCSFDCNSNGGTYRGDNTSCTPDPCGASGVCCRGATCSTTTSDQCSVASGTAGAHFVGAGSSCGASASSPCCYADYNKVNGISVQDIFSFLSDWFAGSPYARVGGDGTPGPVTVQYIFNFLSAWFAGGC